MIRLSLQDCPSCEKQYSAIGLQLLGVNFPSTLSTFGLFSPRELRKWGKKLEILKEMYPFPLVNETSSTHLAASNAFEQHRAD